VSGIHARQPVEQRWLRPFGALLARLDTAAGWAIVALMTVMVGVVSLQVAMRYLLNSSIGWADELSRLTFVWSIFLGIPLGIRAGAHIGMEIVTARLPGPVRGALARFMAVVAAALMILAAYEAATVAWDQWDEKMASFEASAQWFLVALAVGCAHSALHLVWIALAGRSTHVMQVATE
jgi:TRAP-type C4-dicarboxylate transport system permease small subunit